MPAPAGGAHADEGASERQAEQRSNAIEPGYRLKAEVLEALVDDLRSRRYSEALQKHTRSALLRFFVHLGGRGMRDLRQVREVDVVAYAGWLAQSRTRAGTVRSVATLRTALSAVRRLFAFLRHEGAILQDPSLDLALPSWRRLPRRVPNQAQARLVVQHPSPFTVRGRRNRAILELLYGTAVRVGE